jgi:hypothetical protein
VFRDGIEAWIAFYPEFSSAADSIAATPGATVADLVVFVEGLQVEGLQPVGDSLLEDIEKAAEDFTRAVEDFADERPLSDLDLGDSGIREWDDEVSIWLAAQPFQLIPANVCISFPTEVMAWPIERLSEYQPMLDCLVDFATDPEGVVAEASAAGLRICELTNDFVQRLSG